MNIYGYFLTYTDYTTDSASHRDYGLVAAESRAEAVEILENQYDGDCATIEEIGIVNVNSEDDCSGLLDKHQLGFFIEAMKQNGYDEEGC